VNTQADARFRLEPEDIPLLETRNVNGESVPLGTLLTVSDSIGPERVNRYNLYPSATINGTTAPSASSGDALNLMEQIAADTLPQGLGHEWTAMSYQEKRSGGQTLMVLAFAMLVVYLILAAQYESWTAPISVILSVPLVVIGAMAALFYRGLDNNVFTQIGLVLLIGLGAKNAILIVEFARANRKQGTPQARIVGLPRGLRCGRLGGTGIPLAGHRGRRSR
jgi:HAE1 family hydrophobic/amphiphilic exporter-1